jgi:hypothetical protein
MTKTEQAAFVKAYGQNVAHHSAEYVAEFVARYSAGDDFDYDFDHISIMDALCMWHSAINFHIDNQKGTA